MELDVSRGFIHPATPFPFEASLTLEAQDVGGETVTFDPVALDVACADAVNAQPIIMDSILGESRGHENRDYFGQVSPNTNWKVGIAHAVELGIGTTEYELIRV